MPELAPGCHLIDTMLHGRPGLHSALLVEGERPALVDVGCQTSASAVGDAVEALGVGPEDLAWIVLTHIHLDHAGGTGDLAARFPRARIVVHPRGARHLADPARLVAASHEVYGDLAPLYGGLAPTPAERIDESPDGHVVEIGGGRTLRVVEAPGHARHHNAILDEGSGTLHAGDAVGIRLDDGGIVPTLPPADVDIQAGQKTIGTLAGLGVERMVLGHFGPVPDVGEALARGAELLAMSARIAASTLPSPSGERIAELMVAEAPLAELAASERGTSELERLNWSRDNCDGLAIWASRLAPARAVSR
jgi:glyoxylase-like metal-dependent hydrolase (beta-lactamase superfamily II)